MSKRTQLILATISGLIPVVALADGVDKTINTVTRISGFVGVVLPRLFFALALVYFFYGLGSYVMGVDDKKKAEAKTTIIYGVIILFVMSSVWGLVNLLQNATDTSDGSVIIPRIDPIQ